MKNGISIKFISHAPQVMKELDRGEKANRVKAAKYAVPKLKEAAPKKTGDLRSSIKVQHWRRSSGVGFARPKGAHAWLVDNGHDLVRGGIKVGRYGKKAGEQYGKVAGRVKGSQFFGRAWSAILPELQKIMSEPII